jgi:hypothetical protein
MEPGGKPPRAAFIEELVEAWEKVAEGRVRHLRNLLK